MVVGRCSQTENARRIRVFAVHGGLPQVGVGSSILGVLLVFHCGTCCFLCVLFVDDSDDNLPVAVCRQPPLICPRLLYHAKGEYMLLFGGTKASRSPFIHREEVSSHQQKSGWISLVLIVEVSANNNPVSITLIPTPPFSTWCIGVYIPGIDNFTLQYNVDIGPTAEQGGDQG